MTPFWFKDPSVLMAKGEMKLWPTPQMDSNAKLNAISRLVVLLSLAAFAATLALKFLVTGLLTLAGIALYQSFQKPHAAVEGFNIEVPVIHTKPTKANPLMNVLLPELNGNPNRPSALQSYTPETAASITEKVKEQISKNVDPKIFRGMNDELDLAYSMRSFHTMPNTTVPNKQDEFSQFLYGDMISAKEGNLEALSRYSPRLGSVTN